MSQSLQKSQRNTRRKSTTNHDIPTYCTVQYFFCLSSNNTLYCVYPLFLLSFIMPACQRFMRLLVALLFGVLIIPVGVMGFCPKPLLAHPHMVPLFAEMSVQVCGFKDCKRAGGGPRLEKLIHTVLEEQGLTTAITVEGCDCQGECGYGPNLVVDGKLINNVKGKEAVLKALGIKQEWAWSSLLVYF